VAAGGDPDVIFARSAALLRREAAVSRATLDRIEALEEPDAARDAVGAWLASNRRQAALIITLAEAFDAHDQTRSPALRGGRRARGAQQRDGARLRDARLRAACGGLDRLTVQPLERG